MVRGTHRMNAFMRISRNMAIIRDGRELSVVNPLRLSAEGETKLESLGKVVRVIRLGAMHGVDDPYYVQRFGAEFWCQPGGVTYPQPRIDREFSSDTTLPFPAAKFYCFAGTKQPESALLVQRGTGLLLTCDAVQNYGDYRHHSLPARALMPLIGFPKRMIIGPFWLKYMTPEQTSLRGEFEKLLSLEFDALLSAHGSFMPSGAKNALRIAIEKTFN